MAIMKFRIRESGPLFCDAGPNEGMYRIDIKGSVYLTAEELREYQSAGRLVLVLGET